MELNLKQILKRILLLTLASLAGILALAYACDYAVLRYRMAGNREPYGSVTVRHYYAVEHKNGKTEFLFDPPTAQTCVHSLFPHAGYAACWYLSRHPEPRTNI